MTTLLLLVACLQTPTLDAEAGFQGDVFPDAWTRVSSIVTYEGEALDAELRITVQAWSLDPVVYRRPLRLVGKARMRIGTDLYLTGRESRVEVELVSRERILRRSSLKLNFQRQNFQRLLVVGTPPPILVQGMGRRPPISLVRLSPEHLPPTPLPLLGVDTIVIPEPIDLDVGQETALQSWVGQGGRLIFGAGRSTHLRQNPFWRDWCPLASPEIGTATVRVKESDLPITLVRGKVVRGRTGAMLGADPAVVRFREGAGEIVFMPVMLDQESLGKVLAGPALLADLLELPPPPVEDLTPPRRGMPRRAVEWLPSNQKAVIPRESVDFLKRVIPADMDLAFPPLAAGAGIIIVYIVLIGPVEFLRLRRKGQLRTGWRSFGLLVVIFGAIMLLWGGRVFPRAPKLVLVTLRDEHQVRTFAAIRPSRGAVYEVNSTGANTPLSPGQAIGSKLPEQTMSVFHPSQVQLPTPPSATRFVVSARPVEAKDGTITAQWASPERKSVLVRNAASYPLKECWFVAKEAVWPVPGGIPPESSVTIELKAPMGFAPWTQAQYKGAPEDHGGWMTDTTWTPVLPSRCGLVLSFHEAMHEVGHPKRSRAPMLERGIDLSQALAKGDVFLAAAFDHNLSGIRTSPDIPAETCGWARIRVREASR